MPYTSSSWELDQPESLREILESDDEEEDQRRKDYAFNERKENFSVDLIKGQSRAK